ncbi:hypothetical protein RM717_18120 [Streptomyces griseus]|uniref:PH domain-containing protein n=2 Tax=Streptomyces TaxID=1883 RepID=A0ABU2W542_9ACTN|nr:hypothetical protein [Streptomyces griseus]MDT0492429.1 hypothetical protein [Streptomyces griseus]
MKRPPVPLPADHIPPGTAAWRTPDARRWLDAAPARWARPVVAVPVLAASLVWDIAASPVDACTTAAPCGTDWPGIGLMALLLLTLYWVVRQPRLALVALGAVLAVFFTEGRSTAVFEEVSALVFLLAAAFTAVGLVHRLALAGRQRELALEAAGAVTHPLPAAARTFRRGQFSFLLAALMLAATVFGVWQTQRVADAYEERAARATQVSGVVTAVQQDGDDIAVLTVEADGRTHRFETDFPEDFPEDSRVDVVVDGDWAALVAEPFDAFGWEMLVMLASVAGLAFFANAVDGRTRARRLRREPLPVLRVLVREDHDDSRTWVFAADDREGLRPILHFHSMYAFEEEDEEEDIDDASEVDLSRVADIFRGEDPPPPLREAVLYGAPCTGAELAFVARDDPDDPDAPDEVSVQCSTTAVKSAVEGGPKLGAWSRRLESARGTKSAKNARRSVDEIAAGLTPTAAPRVWKAHGFSRAIGLGLLVVQGGGIWAALDDGLSWTWLWLIVGVPWLVTAVSTALTWRITADRDGLWVTGAWRVRQVRWDEITAVRHSDNGIHLRLGKDSTVEVSPTGWVWLERRLGREPYAVRAAEELGALLLRPELRPLEEAPTARQGMPVGPPLVALSVLWGAAVLLLL